MIFTAGVLARLCSPSLAPGLSLSLSLPLSTPQHSRRCSLTRVGHMLRRCLSLHTWHRHNLFSDACNQPCSRVGSLWIREPAVDISHPTFRTCEPETLSAKMINQPAGSLAPSCSRITRKRAGTSCTWSIPNIVLPAQGRISDHIDPCGGDY